MSIASKEVTEDLYSTCIFADLLNNFGSALQVCSVTNLHMLARVVRVLKYTCMSLNKSTVLPSCSSICRLIVEYVLTLNEFLLSLLIE